MTDPDIEAACEDITKGLKTHRGCSPGRESLLPCPFCGSHSIDIETITSTQGDSHSFMFQCDNCEAIGPGMNLSLDAGYTNWNTRAVAQRQTEPVAFINRRIEDLAEANALYGKDNRLGAPDKIARNKREISWLKELRSMILTPSSLSSTDREAGK